MKVFISILISIISFRSFGQDYFEYQRTFSSIDNDILSDKLPLASTRLDTVYNSYNFIYARHCIKALQVNCILNDTTRADKWLRKCFRQGVPLWMIRNNDLTRKVFDYKSTAMSIKLYDSLRAAYYASINLSLAKTIDSLFTIDQKRTNRVNNGFFMLRYTIYGLQWLKNNNKEFAIIKDITTKYGFPGERLIGLSPYYQDSSQSFKNVSFYGPTPDDYRAYFMLIHYFSNPHKDMNSALLKNVKNGYFPSYQYGAINDFMAENNKKKYGTFPFYNVWHSDPDSSNINAINLRRLLIGLSTFEEQERNDKLSLERRKNRIMNMAIMLE